MVLAPEPLAESLALEGVTVWAADPIDAFAPEDQRAFLDFLDGGDEAMRAVDGSDAVVVEDDSDAAELMAGADRFRGQPAHGRLDALPAPTEARRDTPYAALSVLPVSVLTCRYFPAGRTRDEVLR